MGLCIRHDCHLVDIFRVHIYMCVQIFTHGFMVSGKAAVSMGPCLAADVLWP